ncbi:MAG: aromatic ring-hydroxylating dioxygenase subunit alpha, partial [Rhodospirillaceae bacterium]|nr:aromatic ring-hydroxylating dioxygenase subunit alpha [Rhodospirillaceae bacterium]
MPVVRRRRALAVTSNEEREIIQTLLRNCSNSTTDMVPDVGFGPVSNYTDPNRLKQEIDVLFRQFPIIVGHVGQLAEPGQFITHNETGVPILVTRNRKGSLKAFMNVCRHRGMRVANELCGKAAMFTCPYHSWNYDLDGRLRGMPQPNGFESIDEESLGLVALPVGERFGLVWVRPSVGDEAFDLDAWLAPMANQLESLDLGDHVVFRAWSVESDMSWRLALEGFLESYHFCSAHKHTACAGYLDNQSVFRDLYPHVRHAVPLPKALEMEGQAPEVWNYRPNFMTQNYLFPCNFVQVMTDHVYIHSIFPKGSGSCVFQCMMLVPEAPETEKAERYWNRNYKVVETVFGEDFEIGQKVQAGLETGANEHFVFGRYERGLHLAQKAIDDALEGRLTAC